MQHKGSQISRTLVGFELAWQDIWILVETLSYHKLVHNACHVMISWDLKSRSVQGLVSGIATAPK